MLCALRRAFKVYLFIFATIASGAVSFLCVAGVRVPFSCLSSSLYDVLI